MKGRGTSTQTLRNLLTETIHIQYEAHKMQAFVMQDVFNNTNKSDSFKKFPGFILEQGVSKGEMMFFLFFFHLFIFCIAFPTTGPAIVVFLPWYSERFEQFAKQMQWLLQQWHWGNLYVHAEYIISACKEGILKFV